MARSGRPGIVRRLRGELAAWRQVDGHLKALYGAIAELNEFRAQVEPLAEIPAVMAWIAEAELRTEPLVSVVMPTKDRGPYLSRAIRSVVAQTYANWELVIVDDGSSPATVEHADSFADSRIRRLPATGAGQHAARNQALGEARGELIAYLDDDNLMHPGWLKSVVWAFEQRPRLNVLYGAIVIDDPARVRGEGEGALPTAYLYRFDRDELAKRNLADLGALAHRAGLPEARFDEQCDGVADWDLLVRLSADGEPLALPALACFYLTDASDRLSRQLSAEVDAAFRDRLRVRARKAG